MSVTDQVANISPVLVVGAHPDDPEFGCGGSIARWVRDGRPVHYVVMTRGDKGSHDPTMTAEELMATREREQLAAAAVLGVTHVRFLDCRDCEVMPSIDLRRQMVQIIRAVKPGTVVTHDPTLVLPREGFVNHPDHRATGTVVIDACFPAAELHLAFPEQLTNGVGLHKVTEILFWGTGEPTYFVDTSETFDLKIQAIAQHKSQVSDIKRTEERMRERARTLGQSNNLAMAEGFRRAARQ